MGYTLNEIRNKEEGFTLVELAVVMIIIGLLIGGVLKGQELITNARVTATASQMESMSAAVNGFRDAYNSAPGDMGNAQARLPDCADPCFDGSGDGIVDNLVGVASAAPADGAGEGSSFFIHLSRGAFITGVEGSDATVGVPNTHPAAPIGGAFNIGDTAAGATTSAFDNARTGGADLTGGLWLVVMSSPVADVAADAGPADSQQAARIDRKLDDGAPDTGSIISNTGNCRNAAGDYDEANNAGQCALAYNLR